MRASKTKKETKTKKEKKEKKEKEEEMSKAIRDVEVDEVKEIKKIKVRMNDVEYSIDSRLVELCKIGDNSIPTDVFETMLFFAEIIIRVGEDTFLQLAKSLGDIVTQNEMKKIQTIDKQILVSLLSYSTDTNIQSLHNFICYTL